ncbi:hypothetical protein [Sphingomonas sp. R1]|uniref:hypothetical protein n=1 Tax=Sphingomonas sp. R1 TaxID=399176 RepID=UPI0022255200|nr:hypothetical protein [Sphingomonas sp. R1]UYY78719.1 hypothetical protein OIM94_06985 [Sphingomonas sp. R1]
MPDLPSDEAATPRRGRRTLLMFLGLGLILLATETRPLRALKADVQDFFHGLVDGAAGR